MRAIVGKALLMAGTALTWSAASSAQTVPVPAGEPPSAGQIGQPSTANSAAASKLSGSDQQAPAPADSGAATDDNGDVIVTGSRIVANGYRAPTPVTVVSSTELLKKAPESIPAGLAKLPQFVGTAGSNVTSSQAGTPSAGNYLNLRRLGSIETLLLLNGQRLPPTSFDGTTDANIVPQALIQRVDVVTGGASAAYGSDAVAGVVNFILDTKFKGLKGSAQYGISSRGDDHQEKISLAAGASLGRLHLEGSFDYFYQPGIPDNGKRPYGGNYDGGYVNVGSNAARPCAAGACAANPFTPVFNVRLANGTYGTLINSGRNTAGATVPFSLNGFTFEPTLAGGPVSAQGVHRADLGTPTGTPNFNVGGADTGVTFGTTLTSLLRTKQGFARADLDLGGVNSFLQGSYTEADTRYVTVAAGSQFQSFQVFSDNAFLPTYVRDQMVAQGVASFVGSRIEADQDPKVAYTNNKALTVLGGLDGRFGGFRWSVTGSHGESDLKTRHSGNFQQQRWFAALDAVRDPATNAIVCRVTLTNPSLYPGCVPWNLFGNGSPSRASYAYFEEDSTFRVKNKQDDVAAQLSGPLFNLPAGAVNIAVGAEYRHQQLTETSNNDPSKPIDLTGLRTYASTYNLTYNSTNVGKAFGKQNIKEAFAELAVPLIHDAPFFRQLDLNGAARYTDYSVSGGIWAWKVGGSWTPVDQLRLRGTYSQDIRAPTLYELFAGVSSTRGTFTDVHTGLNTNTITLTQGNANLKPETARTLTLGAIWQPTFFRGFSLSVDYFRIKIRDQITRLSTTDLNQRCEDSGGTDPVCAFITRPFPFSDRSTTGGPTGSGNFPINISQVPFNQASLVTHGFDYEVNWLLPLGPGKLDLRFLGNYTPELTTKSSATAIPVLNAAVAGTGVPRHKFTASADYTQGGFNFGIDLRYIGTLYYTRQPTVFVDNNRLSPVAYLNANISYEIKSGDRSMTLFLSGTNLTDKFVFAPQNAAQPTEFYPSFQSQYDVVGRYFVTGIRVKY